MNFNHLSFVITVYVILFSILSVTAIKVSTCFTAVRSGDYAGLGEPLRLLKPRPEQYLDFKVISNTSLEVTFEIMPYLLYC